MPTSDIGPCTDGSVCRNRGVASSTGSSCEDGSACSNLKQDGGFVGRSVFSSDRWKQNSQAFTQDQFKETSMQSSLGREDVRGRYVRQSSSGSSSGSGSSSERARVRVVRVGLCVRARLVF